jgi:hypothetical protein
MWSTDPTDMLVQYGDSSRQPGHSRCLAVTSERSDFLRHGLEVANDGLWETAHPALLVVREVFIGV